MPYIQFAIQTRRSDLCLELINYGFTYLFQKLVWTERILALDIAQRMQAPDFSKLLEMVKIQFMRDGFEDILAERTDIRGKVQRVHSQNMI